MFEFHQLWLYTSGFRIGKMNLIFTERNRSMKIVFITAFIMHSIFSLAQDTLEPRKGVVDKKWVRNGGYIMDWYMMADTSRRLMGTVATRVEEDADELRVITQVSLQHVSSGWVDSTVANWRTLRPVYHSSYNAQRDMALHFGPIVRGFYHDKSKQTNYEVNDTVGGGYFDSNLYPLIIGWLPLREGYSAVMKIYDYNPSSGHKGLLNARVHGVRSGSYKTLRRGSREVWIAEVSDELGSDPSSRSFYYIDKKTRQLWLQEIIAGGRKMAMVLREY
jgi:hypothetical protein